VNKIVKLSSRQKVKEFGHPMKFNPLIEHLDVLLENVDL